MSALWRLAAASLFLAFSGAVLSAPPATLDSPPANKAPTKLTLQYRVAQDAFAPSRFVAVIGDGITMGMGLTWALPDPGTEQARAALAKQKEEFLRLIQILEERAINGVEFECTGAMDVLEVRGTTVPRLTPSGKRRIEGTD